ncbi:MAG: BamA/TamA family outer membrane protein [Candidatus Latescibacteria bacterium]|nr:BamA/TamA family outer membrane protein [Candidatus Latescibacterota bacterium]
MKQSKRIWGMVLYAGLVAVGGAWAHGGKGPADQDEKYLGWEQKWQAVGGENWASEDVYLRYNRVEGLFMGAREPRSYRGNRGHTSYGHLGYSFGASHWQYQVGTEVFTFHGPSQWGRNLSSIGGELHDVTASQDGWLLSAEENSLYAGLFRRDFFDYYRSRGWSLYTIQNFAGLVHLTGRLGQDEFYALDELVDWVLVDNRVARKAFRANPDIDVGTATSLRLDIQLDNRRPGQRRGWLVNHMIEQGGGGLGGDFAFRRQLFEVRRYQPLAQGAGQLDLRLRLGRGERQMPRQYQYDIGGFASLRGYPYKAFSGDRMVLFNAEYWIEDIGVLFDMGAAWFSPAGAQRALAGGLIEPAIQAEFKKSLGFAARIDDDFQLGMARPLDGEEEDWRYFARCSRTF